MASIGEKKLSADEFAAAAELTGGHELVRGELVPTMPSNLVHAQIAAFLTYKLNDQVQPNRLGTVLANDPGFQLGPETLRGPDVAFITRGRLPEKLQPEFGRLAPDLAVEIVSPNDTAYEIEDKVQTYLEAGTRLVWVIYPHRQTVHVYRPGDQAAVLSAGAALDGEDVVPGFALPIKELFAGDA